CRVSAAPLPGDEASRGIVVLYADITKRKEAEQSLNEALGRQKAIFAASPYGIGVFRDRQCLMLSPSFERMFGYESGELAGASTRVLFTSDDDFARMGEELFPRMRRGEIFDFETRMMRKDGTLFWCHMTTAPLAGECGI